ncbi:MAG TPA: potassium transporter Kup [Acidobacteria bacterium]|nr:potassium transporter Kup [Acidobacteriota bacterium]
MENEQQHRTGLAVLVLGALGVVFGDIGTSPLYAFRVCFSGEQGLPVTPANVLGILSLIFWSLVLVITIKYMLFVMRADNGGEGGILALTALLIPGRKERLSGSMWTLIGLGVFGAALLFGDGMITPAISVLSAVEGLAVAAPGLSRAIQPLAIAILIALFVLQRRGTESIGRLFGPVMLLWFSVLAGLGVAQIARTPAVLAGISPVHAIRFFAANSVRGFLTLGAVFLVVTGGEALYADMGHFGKRPIQIAWLALVFPALLINYFGQGALLIRSPQAIRNPFFLLAPSWTVIPMVILSTAATVIASQAVISGAFSLSRQAVQLGYSPRLVIRHTSPRQIGQIYVPSVNWTLLIATIGLVLGFGSSDNLAAAYGVAVTTTMVITTVLFYSVSRRRWKWSLWLAAAVSGTFLVFDLGFFIANLVKIPEGGWFPLLVAGIVFTGMTTWHRGRQILARRLREEMFPVEEFLTDVTANPPVRVPGTAVFMSGTSRGIPHALLHNLKHNHVLHERVILLTVVTEEVPRVGEKERVEVQELGAGMYRIVAHYGFMETPDIPSLARLLTRNGFPLDPRSTSFFLGRENLISTPRPGMARWRERLFAFMSRNALSATQFFGLPVNRVVEFGIQLEI